MKRSYKARGKLLPVKSRQCISFSWNFSMGYMVYLVFINFLPPPCAYIGFEVLFSLLACSEVLPIWIQSWVGFFIVFTKGLKIFWHSFSPLKLPLGSTKSLNPGSHYIIKSWSTLLLYSVVCIVCFCHIEWKKWKKSAAGRVQDFFFVKTIYASTPGPDPKFFFLNIFLKSFINDATFT